MWSSTRPSTRRTSTACASSGWSVSRRKAIRYRALARRVGPLLVYGDHPYGRSPTGTQASIQKLTRDDLVNFYKEHYGPADSASVLVGDVTEAEAHKIAEHSFGGWTGTASSAATIPPAPEMQSTRVVIVDKPGAPQSAPTMLADWRARKLARRSHTPRNELHAGWQLWQPHQHEPA